MSGVPISRPSGETEPATTTIERAMKNETHIDERVMDIVQRLGKLVGGAIGDEGLVLGEKRRHSQK